MTNALRTIRTCKVCNEDRHHQGRGLCATCYGREQRHGRLEQWPPLGRRVPHPGRRKSTTDDGAAAPLELGDPRLGDPVIVERLIARQPAKAIHPDDRALVLAAHLDGRLGKTAATRAMNCNTDIMDATIAAAKKAIAA